ncbi:MAG: Fe-S cluster assembly transcriptional regulator IscR [Gallionella sp.]|nr:Fe-S cluster assembly transcriptional regulator IscR [Gallionella sp.]
MRLTTKGRFAVTAVLDLAMRASKKPVTLISISTRQNISLSYLEQLFGKLRRNNIVESVRGPGGGYYLARSAGKITVADIVQAVDEKVDATNCDGEGNCQGGQPCITHDLWMGLNEKIYDYLESVSVQQLVDSQNKRQVAASVISVAGAAKSTTASI